ncbi:PepSY-associated TM helix domain-containing protein [Bacillus sp. AK031]
MEAIKLESKDREKPKRKVQTDIYRAVWRWHFYAGILFAPFLIILAFSGAVYLFKPQIESMLYKDLYYVQDSGDSLKVSKQIEKVQEEYPGGIITSYKVSDDPSRTTEIGLMENSVMSTVYVNPYSGQIHGSMENSEKFTEIFKKLHSELIIGGTFANRLVELAACWCIILLVTGLYIWWPRNKASIWGTVLPRFKSRGRTFWRDMHAVPAFWLSLFIVILIATGLPWSGVMGEQINRLAASTNSGYPAFAFAFGPKPESVVTAKDVAEDVPWASENLEVPASGTGVQQLALDEVSSIAAAESINKPYTVSMPQGEKGVYTIATSHTKPGDNATLHVDQFSGEVLTDVRFSDYGLMAKAITMGIALHEGRLFGLANQIIGLVVCLGLIGFIVSSLMMWKKRKPQGKLGSSPKPKDKRITRTVFIIMLVLGVIMPLVGLSIVIIFVLDRFVFTKIKPLQNWLN